MPIASNDPGQAWWNHYVTMKFNDVIYPTNQWSPGYDPVFAANLGWCYMNRAYGFAEYDMSVHPYAGSNGARDWGYPAGMSNGPTKS
jgi:hypothetical protein